MKYIVAVIRLLVAISGITAIVATFLDTASRASINPFNFFGYFTIQSNIIIIVVLAGVAISTLLGRPRSLELVRGCATTYIVLVGVVYNTLLAGLEGGVSLPWANTVLHVILPLYAAAEWILVDDRGPLAWNRLWVTLVYPLVWIIVVLIRGATDGWVPYPFLDPSLGYGVVAAYSFGIAIATMVVASAVWGLSRVHIFRGQPSLDIVNPATSKGTSGQQ